MRDYNAGQNGSNAYKSGNWRLDGWNPYAGEEEPIQGCGAGKCFQEEPYDPGMEGYAADGQRKQEIYESVKMPVLSQEEQDDLEVWPRRPGRPGKPAGICPSKPEGMRPPRPEGKPDWPQRPGHPGKPGGMYPPRPEGKPDWPQRPGHSGKPGGMYPPQPEGKPDWPQRPGHPGKPGGMYPPQPTGKPDWPQRPGHPGKPGGMYPPQPEGKPDWPQNPGRPGALGGMDDGRLRGGQEYPDILKEEEEIEKDLRRLQSMYPQTVKKILPYVEETCDKMEYEGSMMFDERPDRNMVQRMSDQIYQKVGDFWEEPAEQPEDEIQFMQYQRDRRPPKKDRRPADLIQILLLQEMHHRRCRHRRCRPHMY